MKKTHRQKLSIILICQLITVVVLTVTTAVFGRPFDWRQSYIGTPFSVFYTPSLLGNNAGYTFGVDGKYLDAENYDARAAFVIPLSRIAALEDHRISRAAADYDGRFKYPYHSHMSSKSALSVGGAYRSGGDYRVVTGFAAPVGNIQTGASVDFFSGQDRPMVSVTAGLSVNVTESSLHVTAHNFLANVRTDDNLFGVSAGVGTVLYSVPHFVLIPADAFGAFYFDGGEVRRREFTARLSFDFTPLLTVREKPGITAIMSGGYTYAKSTPAIANTSGGKIFASLGIVFMGGKTSYALFGARDLDDIEYGAFVYNSFTEGSTGMLTGERFGVSLSQRETEDGRILFDLVCRRANIVSWVLRIDGQNGESVKTFSGGSVVPSTILWDKTSSLGEAVKGESVRAKLVVKGLGGTIAESGWVLIP